MSMSMIEIEQALKQLRLSGVRATLQTRLLESQAANLSFLESFSAILRRSNLITSNRIIEDWDKYLGDAAQATAILDRLMHRSVLVEFRGKSYRLKEAAGRLVKGHDSE
ncbi:MAG TPA: ATP-binding protein [Casimicrobiaceae bacterium]